MRNSQTAAMFFELMNERKLEVMGVHLKEDAQLFFPKTQPLSGKDRIVKFFHILFRQYPELHFDIEHIVSQESWVAVHWKNRGVNRKGEPYDNEGVTLFQFDGDKIKLISDFFKDTGKF